MDTYSVTPFKVLTEQGLSWLKQIKESHGSVALTTMVQVEAINSSGIYYIADGDKAKETKHANSGGKLCLENLVCLVVPENKDKNREEKIYSLEEVKDVQSKLMLIAGKAESGKEDVDQFNEVCVHFELNEIATNYELLSTGMNTENNYE